MFVLKKAAIGRFEEIKAWQKARSFCKEVFLLFKETGLKRDFSLKDQIDRSSGSIMDNIAEGFGRGANTEFIRYLEISYASACESQSQLYRIYDREYISKEKLEHLYGIVEEIKKMATSLMSYFSQSPVAGYKSRLKNR